MNGMATVTIKGNSLTSVQDALAEVKNIIGYEENGGNGWNSNSMDTSGYNSASTEPPAPPPTAEPEYEQIDWQAAARESVRKASKISSEHFLITYFFSCVGS